MILSRSKSTVEKALDINLDPFWYGSFAEIGAGQEVARQFFQAGKASQTIALTISAYDMTFSDIIYGKEKNGRYVCESRLQKMLDKEYTKLIDRLENIRGDKTHFFAFADTVATASEGKKRNSHGWLGLKFQTDVKSEPSEIILHLQLLDKHRLQQQETLSVFGVNLIHSCFYQRSTMDVFVQTLFEHIKVGSLAIDAIHTKGPAFKHFNDLKLNLMLLEKGFSPAIFINHHGVVQNGSDAFWGKSLLIQRAFYNPVTKTHIEVIEKGLKHFKDEFKLHNSNSDTNSIMTLFEFTLNNRLKGSHISIEEALKKIEMISSLNQPILVTGFALFYQLKEYLRQITDQAVAIIAGANHLQKLFDETFYYDLTGGLLEGMGKLLDQKTRLYIYPHKTKEICLNTKSFFLSSENNLIYKHLLNKSMIQDIAGCDEISEFIHSEDVMKMIQTNNSEWKKFVPVSVQKVLIKQLNLEK